MIYQTQFYSFAAERKDESKPENNRVYILQMLPGSPWEEIESVLSEMQETFKAMKANALKAEEERLKLEKQTVYEDKPIEPEVING